MSRASPVPVARLTAGAVAVIAGTMLLAWLAGPMGPLSCVGHFARRVLPATTTSTR